jgi:hypothetical protein
MEAPSQARIRIQAHIQGRVVKALEGKQITNGMEGND